MKRTLQKSLMFLMLSLQFVTCGKSVCRMSSVQRGKPEIKNTVVVFAATSLAEVLAEIIDTFEVRSQVEIKLNLASSGTLARQIEQGATPDIFLSANKKWADFVDSLGFFVNGLKSEIARNQLVLVVPVSSKLPVMEIDGSPDFISLLETDRLSIGDPSHVPAGKYAMQSLRYYGWQGFLKGKTIRTKDVRSALMVVEMQEASLGIVYKTDAQKSENVKIVYTFPEYSHKPIVYIGGVCKENPETISFFSFLNDNITRTLWEKHGFKK